jgi:hypothetical protein
MSQKIVMFKNNGNHKRRILPCKRERSFCSIFALLAFLHHEGHYALRPLTRGYFYKLLNLWPGSRPARATVQGRVPHYTYTMFLMLRLHKCKLIGKVLAPESSQSHSRIVFRSPGSSLGSEIIYPNWGFSWLSPENSGIPQIMTSPFLSFPPNFIIHIEMDRRCREWCTRVQREEVEAKES